MLHIGAKYSRDVLTLVLCESFDNGDLTLEEAVAAAELILNRNAVEFYKLEGTRTAFNSSLSRSHSTESLLRLRESLAPSLTVEKPPSFEFRIPDPVPRPSHPNGSTSGVAHPKDAYHDANPTPRFGIPQPEQIPKSADLKTGALAPVPVTPVAPVVAVSEEVVPETAMAVVKPIEVKRVRLLYADTSGQLRCRVCSPLFRVFTDLSYGYSREKVDRWRPLFVEKMTDDI
jgi:hypothetical protein